MSDMEQDPPQEIDPEIGQDTPISDEAEMGAEPEGLALDEMQMGDMGGFDDNEEKKADDLEAVFDVPVRVSAVLGKTKMPISDLLNLDSGTVLELDKQVGEPIDIYINSRLVARGEVVLLEEKLGVTMTEIIKAG